MILFYVVWLGICLWNSLCDYYLPGFYFSYSNFRRYLKVRIRVYIHLLYYSLIDDLPGVTTLLCIVKWVSNAFRCIVLFLR